MAFASIQRALIKKVFLDENRLNGQFAASARVMGRIVKDRLTTKSALGYWSGWSRQPALVICAHGCGSKTKESLFCSDEPARRQLNQISNPWRLKNWFMSWKNESPFAGNSWLHNISRLRVVWVYGVICYMRDWSSLVGYQLLYFTEFQVKSKQTEDYNHGSHGLEGDALERVNKRIIFLKPFKFMS